MIEIIIKLLFLIICLYVVYSLGYYFGHRKKIYPKGWLITMQEDGIYFNRKEYPSLTNDDWTKIFIDSLEEKYTIKFKEKE